MSRLIDLITELCPNGVEYRTLSEVIDYEQPIKYIVESTNYNDDFTIPVLTAGASFILGYTDETKSIYAATKACPVIIFDDFTTSFHWVDFGFKVKSSAMKILTPKDESIVTLRYLFFAMKCIPFQPSQHARHWIQMYSKFRIPIPPLPIQQQIVRILDKFTTLEVELEAELTERKKQYEYYRDELLTFGKEIERKFLWEVTIWDKKFNAVDRYKQSKVINYPYLLAVELFALEKDGGNVFLLSTGEKTGWTTEELAGDNLCEGEVVTIPWGKSRPVKDVIKYYKGKFVTADNRIATSANTTILLNKYLYYFLLTQGEVIDTFYRGSGIEHPSMKAVLDMQIPLPRLAEQERIVTILDRFDTLCNDLTSGIPAEIEARRKQYVYYSDKLLTFKEKVL
jgi:type I restriction enzyme S subunit